MPANPADNSVKAHARWLLTGGHAHLDFDTAVDEMPDNQLGRIPEGMDHSVWQLVEHLRIVQWDMLEFTRDPNHHSPDWPDGYWPAPEPGEDQWKDTLRQWHADRKAFLALIDEADDLLSGEHTLLRNAMVLADHDAYHLGQIVLVRKALKCWD